MGTESRFFPSVRNHNAMKCLYNFRILESRAL